MSDIVMPQLGESVTEGTITRWFKSVGDTVTEDEPLFEVSTDKVDTEVPAPGSGVLTEIRVEEGDTVDVGHGAGRARASPAPLPPRPAAEPPPAAEPVAAPAPVADTCSRGAPRRRAGPRTCCSPAPAPAAAPRCSGPRSCCCSGPRSFGRRCTGRGR